MKTLGFFLISILSCYWFPWWLTALSAFVYALAFWDQPNLAFKAGFFCSGLAWSVLALIKSFNNNEILAKRVAVMLHLPHWIFLILMTFIIGGLIGGCASLTAVTTKKAVFLSKR